MILEQHRSGLMDVVARVCPMLYPIKLLRPGNANAGRLSVLKGVCGFVYASEGHEDPIPETALTTAPG